MFYLFLKHFFRTQLFTNQRLSENFVQSQKRTRVDLHHALNSRKGNRFIHTVYTAVPLRKILGRQVSVRTEYVRVRQAVRIGTAAHRKGLLVFAHNAVGDLAKQLNHLALTVEQIGVDTAHRFDEVKELLWHMAQRFLPWLMSLDENTHDMFNDLHMLFGAACAMAELQIALPGKIETDIPLKNVLDRRPFI